MKREITCNHPELYPTQWNQPKPEPWQGFTCECGQNWICPICGWGMGSWPCDCNRKRINEKLHKELLEKSLVDNADIWSELAKH